MKMKYTKTFAVAALLTTGTLGFNASADLVEASTWQGDGTEANYSNAVGWQFTALDDLTITHLGVLDLGEAGLADRHTVGIFDSEGNLLVSSTIGAGLSGDLFADSMIYNTVELTTLEEGESYYILADNWLQDDFGWGWDAVSYSDHIEWTNFSESTGASIFASVQHFNGEPGNLGPGFMYRIVPSPGALALLGLSGCAARRRRAG